MLENMRKQGASLFIWVIFAILIAVFVINFGPQSPTSGQGGGCTSAGRRTLLTVGDNKVDDVGFRFAMNLVPGESDTERAAVAFESLIMRELLAAEGERRGLRVPDGYVDHVISEGNLHFQGALLQQGSTVLDFRRAFYNEDGIFDYEQFKRWVQNRGLSVASYKRQQTREILASMMANILMNSVPASREEALDTYISRNTTVSFEAVRFDPRRYADALLVSDEDVDRWAAAHEAEVKATYADALFKAKKQFHARRISLLKAAPAEPAKPEDAAKADPNKAKLEAVRASIVAGKTTFAAAARANDRDPSLAARGGDLGWFDDGAPTLEHAALNDALKALEQGKLSEVIETDDGFYLLTVDDKREGDLTFDQVKRELAEPLAREAWGREAARRAAISAIAMVKAGVGKNLKDLFATDKMGARPVVGEDVPVAWLQETPAPTPAAPVPAAPTTPAAIPTAPAAGAPTPTPTPTPTPAKPAGLMIPTDEKLPALGNFEPPGLESFGPVSRAGNRTPLGESPALAKALFEQLTNGAVGQEIYEVRPSVTSPPQYVIVQVTAKDLAEVTEFEKEADRYIAILARERGGRYLVDWLRERCTALASKNEIQPARDAIQPYDDAGNKLPITYAPCMSFNIQ